MSSEYIADRLTWSGLAMAAVPDPEPAFTGWPGGGAGDSPSVTLTGDSLNYELPTYEDSIFSNIPIVGPIIDWIEGQLSALYSWLVSQFLWAVSWIQSAVNAVVGMVVAPVVTAVNWIRDKVLDVWHWVSSSIPAAVEAIKVKVLDVWNWVTSAIPKGIDWIKTKVGEVWTAITTTVARGLEWIKLKLGDAWTWVTTKIPQALDFVKVKLGDAWTWISTEVPRTIDWIGGRFVDMVESMTAIFSDIVKWIDTNVADPILDGITTFVKAFFDFGNWIPNLLKAVGGYLTENLPTGHSPRWQEICRSILDFFLPGFLEAKTPEEAAAVYGREWLMGPFRMLGKLFTMIFNDFMHVLTESIKKVGPQTSSEAMINFNTISNTLMTSLEGLFGLTMAGELVKFLGHVGLGHLAAMIYDMTNYREITGGLVKAFSVAVIGTPARFYFNELVRPNLPRVGDVTEMFHRELITQDEYSKYLGYEGIPDFWHEKISKVAETPIRYFTLSAIAKAGFYDPAFFEAELVRGGYATETRLQLSRMFQATESEELKGLMVGTAVKRYKEGMTTEAQFLAELEVLGYTQSQKPRYLAAAKLEFAYDYLSDMIAALREAVRKGLISTDQFRKNLVRLGIVPDRVENYVNRETIRITPSELPKPIGPPKALYLTDVGEVQLDTLRIERRKNLVTRDAEIAELIKLGMAPEHATAIADNDDARIAEEAAALKGPVKPLYETDAGKVLVDTLRRSRRKELVTRDEEIAGLVQLEMPDLYATAIAENDEVRLAESGAG